MTEPHFIEDDELFESGRPMPTEGVKIDPEEFRKMVYGNDPRAADRKDKSDPPHSNGGNGADDGPVHTASSDSGQQADDDSWPDDGDFFGAPDQGADDEASARSYDESLSLAPIIPFSVGCLLPKGVAFGSDTAGAHLLRLLHGDDLLYSSELGWLVWDGRRYAAESKDALRVAIRIMNIGRGLFLGAAQILATAAKKGLTGDALAAAEKRAEALRSWAKRVQSASGVEKITKLARSLVSVQHGELDADPWLLTVENGTVDLRSGKLGEHRRGDKISKLAPVHYTPGQACPKWIEFVEEILPDVEVREFVQRYLGYALTGSTREQCMVVALGKGANGKSVMSEVMRSLLGDYARDSPSDTFMQVMNGRGIENDIARLRGARFVTCKETEEGKRLDESRVKQLTGEDTVSARFLFKEHFEFIPNFKLWLYANHRPRITGTDDGIWRRVKLVMFGVTIPYANQDRELKSKLVAEASGVLDWLIAGCLKWLSIGLKPPDSVLAVTAEWRAASDEIQLFIDDCCTVGNFAVKPRALFLRYQAWAQEQGNKTPFTQRTFKNRLEALGYAQDRSSDARCWQGLGLVADRDEREADSDFADERF